MQPDSLSDYWVRERPDCWERYCSDWIADKCRLTTRATIIRIPGVNTIAVRQTKRVPGGVSQTKRVPGKPKASPNPTQPKRRIFWHNTPIWFSCDSRNSPKLRL